MKVLAAYTGSFVLYWLGHGTSVLFRWFDGLAFLYPVYNRLMGWSCDLEDWAGISYNWDKPE